MELKIKAVSPKIGGEIPYPYYASAGAAAMDLHACLDEPVTIGPGELVRIPTGIANGVGVIDSDYRGEIQVGLTNLSRTPYTISPADRIAQLAVVPVVRVDPVPVADLDETERGNGGFGSTGL